MTRLIEIIGVPGIVAIFILGCCGIYLTSGRKDKDGDFESGVSKIGLFIVSLLVIVLMIRFGIL